MVCRVLNSLHVDDRVNQLDTYFERSSYRAKNLLQFVDNGKIEKSSNAFLNYMSRNVALDLFETIKRGGEYVLLTGRYSCVFAPLKSKLRKLFGIVHNEIYRRMKDRGLVD